MPGTHHIFFHDDVDGIISGALYLHSIDGSRYRLYPVSSIMRGEKFGNLISMAKKSKYDVRIVVDYQYHKDADLWIDHHYDPNFGDCMIKNENVFYNPKSKSAARLVSKVIDAPSWHKEGCIQEDLAMVDMIDCADYPDVEMIFKSKHPAMILRAYLEKAFPSEMTFCRLVENIASTKVDIKESLYRMKIGQEHVKDLERSALQIKGELLIAKKISIVNQRRRNQYPRYAEYLVMPEIKYCIRLTPVGNGCVSFQIGFNAWQGEPNKLNIGKVLSEISREYIINAGGHFNVGAGVVKEDGVNRLIDDISQIFNEEKEGVMEKYAVDSTDPVEANATNLVKEGSVKNMDQARIEALKNQEKKDGADSPTSSPNASPQTV